MQEFFAVVLFVVVLLLIALEVVNRTVAALLGTAILISFGVLDQEQAATEFVDWNTIGLLAGMMVIVAILERTGVFEYLAIKSAQWGKARSGRILILIADALESSPTPFLLTQVMASNVGGAATLIGDPPNILIGSAADLSFLDFVFALTPVVLLTLPGVLGVLYLMFRKDLSHSKDAEETIGAMDAVASIRDPILLRKSLIVLGLVIVAFFLHGALHLEAATIALFGAAALMLYARSDVEGILREVEWPTLLFFVGLFVLVGGLEATGFVGSIATALTNVAGGTSALTAIVVIWGSGIASGVVDNIPFTATMIPVY